MIRLTILILISISLFAKANTDAQIKKTSSKLSLSSQYYKSVNQKMAKNAKEILTQKAEIKKQNSILRSLQSILKKKESNYKNNTKQLGLLNKYSSKLKNKQDTIEQELVFIIAKNVSLSLLLQEKNAVDIESLIELEVLKQMLDKTKNRASGLNTKFYENSKNITTLNTHTSKLKDMIIGIDKKRRKLKEVQAKNKKSLKKLNLSKAIYKRELKKLINKQNALKKTLSALNILKVDDARRDRERRERKRAFAKQSAPTNNNGVKVKKVGTSYQALKTKRYRGKKTIAPLASYRITKKYGTYTDPIYGIKIFNESISLKPRKRGAKVRTVFNGKVIYADKTAVLNNIVIISHKDGLHTIYANLSKIAPNIKKGKKIKKGYTVGRVEDELIFEVTQKSYHINPIRLFK